jgi:hypothetical protein
MRRFLYLVIIFILYFIGATVFCWSERGQANFYTAVAGTVFSVSQPYVTSLQNSCYFTNLPDFSCEHSLYQTSPKEFVNYSLSQNSIFS